MKSKFSLLGIFAALVIGITTIFIGCKKEDVNAVVKYYGKVVYVNTSTPFPDLEVKVTDGENTHCQGHTDAEGKFSLSVKVDEINGNYYVLVGDSTCEPKKVALPGFGQPEIDLGTIEIEGPSLPVVSTKAVKEIRADAAVTGGKVTSDGRLTVIARGVCYGKEAYPTIDGLHTTDGTGKGEFTSNLKELEYNTVYYARAYATNKMGTAYGEQIKFETLNGLPVVVTDSVGHVTANSVICYGKVTSDCYIAVTERGFVYGTNQFPTVEANSHVANGKGLGSFTSSLTQLEPGQTYYIRAYATNATGTEYGEQKSIQTSNGMPILTSTSSTTTATSIIAGGNITFNGGYQVTERGVCWSNVNAEPSINDNHLANGSGSGTYSVTISKLTPNTMYYVRAYATNSVGTAYGEVLRITTMDGQAVLKKPTIANITALTATSNISVTSNGGATLQECGICWSTTPNPVIDDNENKVVGGNAVNTTYTCNLTNLAPNTTYYLRSYAITDIATSYSEQVTFSTTTGLPEIKTVSVTASSVNISVSGSISGDAGYAVTTRGACYSTTNALPTIEDKVVNSGKGTGSFSCTITEISLSTTYYVRAYATNSIGTAYGEVIKVTTGDGLPKVTTAQTTATSINITSGGNVTDDKGYAITARGVCYSSTNSAPTIEDKIATNGTGKGSYTCTINEISLNTTYYVRAFATNSTGTSYGDVVKVTTGDGMPKVSTAQTTATSTNITSGGNVTDDKGYAITARGVCYSTTNSAPTIADKMVANGTGKGAYSCTITEISLSTTYYVRAFATNSVGTSYGEVMTVTTGDGMPEVTTSETSATSTTITSGGNVTNDKGYSITSRGVCYSTTNSSPTIADEFVASGTGTGSFSSTITGVSVSTTYYVRAYATNSVGTAYGNVYTVTTGDGLPKVATTSPGENITKTSIMTGGQIIDNGGYKITECGVCYGTTPYPAISTASKVTAEVTTGYFACSITGIDAYANTYYIRAYATNANGTTYGEQIEITPEMAEYATLPTMTYGGYTYKIYAKSGSMTWQNGYNACRNMEFGGYSDWFMPSYEEAYALLGYISISIVWTTKVYNSAQHWYYEKINNTWTYGHTTDDTLLGVVAVRKY